MKPSHQIRIVEAKQLDDSIGDAFVSAGPTALKFGDKNHSRRPQ